jgi:hypothetical protein
MEQAEMNKTTGKVVVAIVPGRAVFPALISATSTSGFSLHDQPLSFVPVPVERDTQSAGARPERCFRDDHA